MNKKKNYTKIILICAVVFLCLSIGVGLIIDHAVKSKKANATNTQIETTIEEDTTASEIKLAIQNLLTKIETMEANFETLENLNDTLRENNTSLEITNSSLQTKLNYANANITELKESLQNIRDAYTEIITYYETVDSDNKQNLTSIQNEYNTLWARYIELSQDNTTVDIKANTENNLKFDATVNSLVNNTIAKTTITNCELKLNNNIKVYVNNELLTNYTILDRKITASNENYKVTFCYYTDKIDTFVFEGLEENETYTVEFKQIEETENNIVRWTYEDTTNYCYIDNNTINLTIVAQDRLLEEDSIETDYPITDNPNSIEYVELTKENYANIYLNGNFIAKTNIDYGRSYDRQNGQYLYPHDLSIKTIEELGDTTLFDSNITIVGTQNDNGNYYWSYWKYGYKGGLSLNGTALTINAEWIYETYRIN